MRYFVRFVCTFRHFASRVLSTHLSTHPVTPATPPARTMALSYDLAMQGYFALYASTMTTFPDQCVTGAPAVERAAGIANA